MHVKNRADVWQCNRYFWWWTLTIYLLFGVTEVQNQDGKTIVLCCMLPCTRLCIQRADPASFISLTPSALTVAFRTARISTLSTGSALLACQAASVDCALRAKSNTARMSGALSAASLRKMLPQASSTHSLF